MLKEQFGGFGSPKASKATKNRVLVTPFCTEDKEVILLLRIARRHFNLGPGVRQSTASTTRARASETLGEVVEFVPAVLDSRIRARPLEFLEEVIDFSTLTPTSRRPRKVGIVIHVVRFHFDFENGHRVSTPRMRGLAF